MRSRVLVALAVAAAVGLPGCASVPDHGPPIAVPNRRLQEAVNPDVNAEIAAPREFGGPLDTVTLMLDAGRTTQNHDQLGEAFMTPAAQDSLKNIVNVSIFRQGEAKVVQESASAASVQLSGTIVGSVDNQGIYQPQPNRPLSMRIGLKHVQGIWRISTPQTAVLVRESDFNQAFQQVTLYFAVSGTQGGSEMLVPEARWQSRSLSRDSIITPIVKLVLRRASPVLSGVTRPAGGTTLRGNVAQQGDDLVLDLSPDIESQNPDYINLFAAEIGWSLGSRLSGSLRLQVNGRPLNVTGVDAVQGPEHWANYNPAARAGSSLYYVSRGRLRKLAVQDGNDNQDDQSRLGGSQSTNGVVSAAISPTEHAVAVVKGAVGKQQLWIGSMTGELNKVLDAHTITRPTWGGSDDEVFAAVDGRPVLIAADGHRTPVSYPQAFGPIRAMRLAPDGVRVAVAAGSETGAHAYMGVLQRLPDGSQVVLRDLRLVQAPLAKQPGTPVIPKVTDVGWAGPTTIAVAGQNADNTAIVRRVSTDWAEEEPSLSTGLRAGAVGLAVTPFTVSPQPAFAESGKQLYQGAAHSWTVVQGMDNISAPFYPG
jgi:hypothetical protein